MLLKFLTCAAVADTNDDVANASHHRRSRDHFPKILSDCFFAPFDVMCVVEVTHNMFNAKLIENTTAHDTTSLAGRLGQ